MLDLILLLVIGFLAGLAANAIMGRRSNSALLDIALGVVGAFVGGWLLNLIGIYAFGFIGTLIAAIIGAIAIIFIVRLFAGNNRSVRF